MTSGHGDAADVRAGRARAQGLHRRSTGGPVEIVRHLLAVQAQDSAAFPLALRARTSGLTESALTEAREAGSLVRCWGPRGTLHLVAAEDLAWFHPLVRPAPAGSLRRLRDLGVEVDADTAVRVTEAALAGRGPLTKPELGERLARAGLPAEGQAIVHLAMLAAGRGRVVLGPERAGKATYVHAGDWLGAPPPVEAPDRERALRTLVARYRAAHDPAEPRDLAAWSGLPPGEIRRAWSDTAAERDHGESDAEPIVRLLPGFDEYLLGWRTRDHAVPTVHRTRVHPGGGVIRSVLLVDGLAAGTWRIRRSPGRADLAVEPFEPLSDAVASGLAAEVAGVGAFLGRPARLTVAD
ncbi:winged helix DNA-binding domain-containing protein [Thermomonospora umbrina]|uniref:Winged helix DNA-binding protein n=1 Tax=Thermomonospora umbrina TaxID=111806 RepID=A0A3D9TBA5_9ACTN|nr:winged helix DNA-binding domain-containing protein [Thermomonospora umbrina]REF01032.1 winged helix DNA-binding protein [Thermomonospora umbrina]